MLEEKKLNVKEKMHVLLKRLGFENLEDFSNEITKGNLNRAKALNSGRIKKFNETEVKLLTSKFNINRDWLLFSDGNFYAKTDEEIQRQDRLIRLIDVENPSDFFYFDKVLISGDYDINNCFAIRLNDDSMNKTIPNGSILICERTKNKADLKIEDGVYIFRNNKKFIIKRLTHTLTEKNNVSLSSDCDTQPAEIMKIKNLPEVVGILKKTITIS